MPNVFDEVEAESKRNVFDEVLEETPPPAAKPGYGLVTAPETPRVPMTTIAPTVAIPWPTEKPGVSIPASPTESFIRPAFEGIKAESKPEQGPITGVAKGLWNVGVGIPEFATSSLGMGSLVVAPLAPRITSGLFTLDIIRNLVKQAPELAKQWDSLSVGQKTQAGTELLAQIGLAMGLGIKTVQGWGRQPLGRPSETQRQAVQFTQELAQKDPAKFGQMAQDAIKKAAEIEQREPGPTPPLPLVPAEERKEAVEPEAVSPPTAAAQAVAAAGQAPAAAAASIPEARTLPAQAAAQMSERARAALASASPEYRRALRAEGLTDADMGDLLSGEASVSDVVARRLKPFEGGGGPDHAKALQEARDDAIARIEALGAKFKTPAAPAAEPTKAQFGDPLNPSNKFTAQPAKLEPDGGIFYAREHRMGELENRPGQSGFLVVDRDAVDEMAFEHDTYQFTPEDVKKTGMKFVSIPELDAAKGDFYEAIQNQKKGAPSAERIREEPGQVPPPGAEPQGGKKEGGHPVEPGAPVEPEPVGARGETPPETLPNAPAREPVLGEPTAKESLTVEAKGKEPWEMTKAEAVEEAVNRASGMTYKKNKKLAELVHKGKVRDALREGKPVPPEVLKDYPDLQPPSKTAVGKGEVQKVSHTDNSVRDHPQQAVIVGDTITVNMKVGKKRVSSYAIPVSEWEQTERGPSANPNYNKFKLVEKYTSRFNLDEQPGGAGQAQRIRDSQRIAIDQAIKKRTPQPTPPPAAETGEKTPMRPGPGAATGGAVEDPIQTLNEQIAALPRSDARTRVSLAERMADRLAAGKDLAHRAALRAQAVTQSLAQTFRGVRTPTELGNRVGEVDYLLQKAAALSRENARVLERSIPDLATRQGLWIWADAHGNEAAIRDAILKLPRETKPAVRRALQASLKLTDKEKAWLPFVREYYDKKAQVAEQMGVLNSVLEDYYTHVWRVKDNMPAKLQAAFNSGKIKEYWQFNRERKLPDILTGIVDPTIVGRRRYVDPETGAETIVESGKRLEPILDPAKIIPHYNYTLDRAIASRAFMKAVSEMKTSTGEPALAPKGVAENRVFNQWAVVNNETGRADPFVQGVFETEAEANAALAGREGYHVEQRPNEYLFIKSHVTPEQIAKYKPIDHPSMRKWQWAGTEGNKTVLYEGELLAHPEVHERLARMMDRSRLTPSPLTRAVLRYSAETKAAKLGMLSSFHLIHVGKHAIFHLTNPFKAAMDSMRSLGGKGIDWESPEVRQAIEKGHLNLAADPGDVAAMSEGAGGAGKLIIHKFPLLGPLSKAFSEWMFQDFIPQLKFQTYRNALQRNLKMYGPQATPTGRVLARAGVLGLPVGRLTPDEVAARTGDAVNAAYGELNKLWLGAHGRNPATQRALRMIFLAPDFGEARLRFVGKGFTAFGNEERLALIMNALMVYSAARVANMLISGNPHNDDARHLFDVKVGDHWLTMRSVLVDVEHAMTNFIQFARIRMNPALVTPLLDLFTGTNWKGQKRNGWQWVKDRLAAYVPAQAQSLTEDNKHLWESWLASMGINPKRADAVAEIHERARRFRDQRGIVSPVDIAVSPEGNPYREARIALEFDDPWRFWRAMQQQVQRLDATNTKQPLKVIEGAFARYYAMPFSGKKSLEPDFVASLAPRDRTIYREAQQRQKETYAKFKDWWRDHKSYLGQ